MKTKTINTILEGTATNVGTFNVQELLPSREYGYYDPFLLFHHGKTKANKNIPVEDQGVGPHPHRGFSPVTFIYKGGIHHHDSRGNHQVVYAGGTQWINAGMGIVHSERMPEKIFELGGEQEILQVWVNSPAKNKMSQPAYVPATKEDTPTIITDDGLTTIRIPAGEIDGVKGIIPTFTNVTTAMGEMKKGGSYNFTFPATHNTLLYVLEGELLINDKQTIITKQMALFDNDGENISVKANADTLFFIGSGTPINEPIAAHGPFVMNTQTEILEAFRDYQMGKMGVLIEE